MPANKDTFEGALAKLEAIVSDIEEGKIGLQESIKRYEEGMGLLKRCQKILTEAELKIQKLQQNADQTIEPGPLSEQTDEP